MYSITYSDRAVKALQKMDRYTAAMIYGWIDKNLNGCDNPRIHGKLLGHELKGYWRYRIGDYRLIADIQEELVIIEIISVGHRRDIYLTVSV